MLRDIDLLPVYDSSEHDLVADLIVPLLKNSCKYMRGVGFFTSGWLRLAGKGLIGLAENGGIARFVISPVLESKDWEAIQLGDLAKRDVELKRALQRSIDELEKSLEADTLNCLAWLVADEILDFRFAIPREPSTGANYHDKVGVFNDGNGDFVAIHGSFNDTLQGSLNGEAFSVFKSWDNGQLPFVQMHKERLTCLWEKGNSQFEIRQIPEAVREQLIQLRTTNERPYNLKRKTPVVEVLPNGPKLPIDLRDYQQEAIRNWEVSGFKGIFEMATGTGKTVTALAAAVNRFEELGNIALIILVPYLHLLEQWADSCRKFGFIPILCSGEHSNWRIRANSVIADFNLGAIPYISLIAVHDTAASEAFRKVTGALRDKKTLVICDEVHALGSPSLSAALLPNADMRLGLSATPRRWYDESGTKIIFDYFTGISYEYSLEAAIENKFLTPYEYHPIPVAMTKDEEGMFAGISSRIAKIWSRAKKEKEAAENLKRLLIERANLIAATSTKLPTLISTLRDMVKKSKESGHELRSVLIYCAPGRHREVLRDVSRLGIKCHEFVHTVSLSDRHKVLSQFAEGEIEVLVAIKCLDEGVDIPTTKTAFFLASTSNPREFVQRRGRILRLAPGKDRAKLYDFIVVPTNDADITVAQSILQREMPRFAEFACAATNEFQARAVVRPILDKYGMLDLLDERPWDIYHQLKESGDVIF